MSHNVNSKKSGLADSVVGVILLALAAYAVYIVYTNTEQFLKFAEETFQLTPLELMLIPCGSALFIVFWLEMKEILFDPFMSLLEEREAVTIGVTEKSEKLQSEALALEKKFQNSITTTKIEAVKEKMQELTRVEEQALELVNQAQVSAEQNLVTARNQIKNDAATLKQQLTHTNAELTDALLYTLQSKEPLEEVIR